MKSLCIFEMKSNERVTVTYSSSQESLDKGPACRICLKDPDTGDKLGWFAADAFRRLFDYAKDGDVVRLGPIALQAHVKEFDSRTLVSMTVTYEPRDESGQTSNRFVTELDDVSCTEIRATLREIFKKEDTLKFLLDSILEAGT